MVDKWPLFRFPLLTGTLRAAIFCVNGDLREAPLDFGLALGGCTGCAAQEVSTEGGLTVEQSSSMAVERCLLWVSVKQSFYTTDCSNLQWDIRKMGRQYESLS